MTQPIDLARAATALEARRPLWSAAGHDVSPALWTDDREHLAVQLASPEWQVLLTVELHSAGWAHLHFASEAGAIRDPCRVRSVDAWGTLLDEAVTRASRIRLQPAKLLAGTCTTGWLDWIHGELWLLPGHLVRVRSGLLQSVLNSQSGSGVTAQDPYRLVGHDPEAIRRAHRTNKVIPFTDIHHARLHGGVSTSGMTLTMTDGTHHKLLWLSTEPARRLLRDRLLPVLGPRLTH
ncbi:hypothetical protein [Streptomyces pseudovenezuelae]|uniref:hypothetical protein n=1 Tax=Streptomyces pseudovenezuelae TaxID=67350 RepID=UPI00247548AD|nr:hypothetical protein [Streptomyces pseudovenezuelae]